uniref:TPR_REGION domain-containing protein n=1 Tax=Caenorhabditis tropicalis TaxID=1561998 RepID=A0A1I7TB82_9PELO
MISQIVLFYGDERVKSKIVKKRISGEVTYIHFVTYLDNELVLGEVVADDLTLLSVSQISATLRYPLGKIISDRDIEAQSSTKWFWLIAIIGIGIFLILIGWCCLFLFYNSCGYMCGTDEDYFFPKKQQYQEQTIGAEQRNDTLPSDGSQPSEMTKKTQLNKKAEKTTGSSRTLGEIYLEKERENVRKAVEAYNKAALEVQTTPMEVASILGPRIVDTEKTEVDTAPATKSEKKRRHTKIGPITAVTTTTRTTNEPEGEMAAEISKVSSVTTPSTDELDEFDVANLPETSLKIIKKKKKDPDPEVRSEPESDYGSSLEDEKSKDEDEKRKEIHVEVHTRPMTAKKQRTSLFGGVLSATLPVQPRAWTAYQAGDRVAEFWNDNNHNSYPTPSAPTENGIIELRSSSNTFTY